MKKIVIILLFVSLLLTACQDKEEEPESPVPVPDSPVSQPSSPLVPPPSEPMASPTPMPRLTLQESIANGATTLKGSGPPGLPIRLYEVGATGSLLGEVTIGEQGTFSVQLVDPLKSGQRVGLALGDLEGTPFKREHFVDQAIIDLPVIGLLFADVTVE